MIIGLNKFTLNYPLLNPEDKIFRIFSHLPGLL